MERIPESGPYQTCRRRSADGTFFFAYGFTGKLWPSTTTAAS